MIQITTFRSVPPIAHGYVRDLGARWALEEINISYKMHLIERSTATTTEYRKLQPFGQVPVYEEDGLILFELGSILLHIGEKSEKLLPKDSAARARARTWVMAALNSVDPRIQLFNQAKSNAEKEAWAKERLPVAQQLMEERLSALNIWLEGREFLENQFTVGDIMMVQVLRNAAGSSGFSKFTNVVNYLNRCESRAAFKKALADQIQTFIDQANF